MDQIRLVSSSRHWQFVIEEELTNDDGRLWSFETEKPAEAHVGGLYETLIVVTDAATLGAWLGIASGFIAGEVGKMVVGDVYRATKRRLIDFFKKGSEKLKPVGDIRGTEIFVHADTSGDVRARNSSIRFVYLQSPQTGFSEMTLANGLQVFERVVVPAIAEGSQSRPPASVRVNGYLGEGFLPDDQRWVISARFDSDDEPDVVCAIPINANHEVQVAAAEPLRNAK